MKLKNTLVILGLLFLGMVNPSLAQTTKASAVIEVLSENKETYALGDQMELRVSITVTPEICTDGMERTKIYLSGLELAKESDWQQVSSGRWTKILSLKVVGNKKNEGKITVLRKADKGDFFIQKKIRIYE